jgi:DNA ligase-1
MVDAVLMYAQRGHGKRSSFYSDFTFGVWKGNEIVPIGKAYFGFTDAELKELDKWVRSNTVQSFGPVREVKKELVLEIAFDSAQKSSRHKSGVALRFPRINRIRWDKPMAEAGTLEEMLTFIEAT